MVRLEDFKPMLLSERSLGLHEPGWIYELKYDGLRMTAAFGDGVAQLRTRNGANATKWFPELGDSLSGVAGGPYVTDGEVCVLDHEGRSDFQALQERARHRCWYVSAKPVVYCVFDLLVDRGVDITTQPLMLRKAALGRLFGEPPWGILVVKYSDKGGAHLVKQPANLPGPEAFIAKRRSSIYLPGVRTSEWVKIKRKPRPAREPAFSFKLHRQ
jgi:bifunctional non-homologous end joining protein LigD